MDAPEPHAEDPRAADPAAPWLQHWFPVAFGVDLLPGVPHAVSVLGRRLCVFRDAQGRARALPDRCPHRGARLTDGRVVGGVVECLYHGWRFGPDGRCLAVPQLEPGGRVPERACLAPLPTVEREELVWVWGGDPARADEALLPLVPAALGEGVHRIDFAIDLPYGQDYLNENVLDLAHIHVAHDGTRGGGSRAHAGPVRFDLEDHGADGFLARFRRSQDASELSGAHVEFRAPNLVHYVSRFDEPDAVAGLALWSLPLAADRCRLLYRAYGNRWDAADLRRPRWREHLFQCHLLEQDMAVVAGQAWDVDRSEGDLADQWLPLRSSDSLVLAFRRWVGAHAAERPGSVGLRGRGSRGVATPVQRVDRHELHVRQCADCSRALGRLRRARPLGRWVGVGGLTLAALSPWPVSVLPALLGLGGWALEHRARSWIRALTRPLDLEGTGPRRPPEPGWPGAPRHESHP